ncbi:20058_t:CDS:2, partial [Gigaspora margarita]
SDLKSTNPLQSSIFVDPKFIFFEKLLEKKHQKEDQYNINSEIDKILSPQTVQTIPSFFEQMEAQKKPLEHYDIPNAFQRNTTDKLIIADKTTKNVMIDFYTLSNPVVANNSKVVVDHYYQHTCHNPQHQSKGFKKQIAETFGAFTSSNNELYTTANMASSHNKNYQQCVNDLIQGLQLLSNAINNYFQKAYPILYMKMKKLDLDPKDHQNTLCIVCPLGSFEGGQLVFPELKLAIHAKQG